VLGLRTWQLLVHGNLILCGRRLTLTLRERWLVCWCLVVV